MILYLIVSLTGFAGLIQASWWTAVAGASLLVLHLAASHEVQLPVSYGDTATSSGTRLATSILNGCIGGCLAYGAGRSSAWLWGI